jgi:hypothetical protein
MLALGAAPANPRDLQREADAVFGAPGRPAAHQPVGRSELGGAVALEPQHGTVEQRRLVEVIDGCERAA